MFRGVQFNNGCEASIATLQSGPHIKLFHRVFLACIGPLGGAHLSHCLHQSLHTLPTNAYDILAKKTLSRTLDSVFKTPKGSRVGLL